MNRWSALLVCLCYGLAMGGTALRVHECGGTWMTELSMMQPLGAGTHAMSCHRSSCKGRCCEHPVIKVKVHQEQLPQGSYTLRPLPLQQLQVLEDGRMGFRARQLSLLATSVHGPPGGLNEGATRRSWLGVYRI